MNTFSTFSQYDLSLFLCFTHKLLFLIMSEKYNHRHFILVCVCVCVLLCSVSKRIYYVCAAAAVAAAADAVCVRVHLCKLCARLHAYIYVVYLLRVSNHCKYLFSLSRRERENLVLRSSSRL